MKQQSKTSNKDKKIIGLLIILGIACIFFFFADDKLFPIITIVICVFWLICIFSPTIEEQEAKEQAKKDAEWWAEKEKERLKKEHEDARQAKWEEYVRQQNGDNYYNSNQKPKTDRWVIIMWNKKLTDIIKQKLDDTSGDGLGPMIDKLKGKAPDHIIKRLYWLNAKRNSWVHENPSLIFDNELDDYIKAAEIVWNFIAFEFYNHDKTSSK